MLIRDRRRKRDGEAGGGEAEQIEVEGFGLTARARGHDLIVVVLIIALFGAIAYLIYQHDQRGHDSDGALAKGQQQVIDELAAMTYVLTLTTAEREKLNVRMPEALRRKMKNGNGRDSEGDQR